MITEREYKNAQEIIKIYELQERKRAAISLLPTLEDGVILEYRDLTGTWFEYTKEMQENIYFYTDRTRVRKIL